MENNTKVVRTLGVLSWAYALISLIGFLPLLGMPIFSGHAAPRIASPLNFILLFWSLSFLHRYAAQEIGKRRPWARATSTTVVTVLLMGFPALALGSLLLLHAAYA